MIMMMMIPVTASVDLDAFFLLDTSCTHLSSIVTTRRFLVSLETNLDILFEVIRLTNCFSLTLIGKDFG